MNLTLAAALYPHGDFLGLDLDPAHISAARQLAAEAGLDNLQFAQRDIAETAASEQHQSFDFIVCHGMWSWIPAQVRQRATQWIAQSLKPQGLAYIGYMSHPGGSVLATLQRLLREYAAGCTGDAAQRVQQALLFVRRLADAGAGLFAEHPGLAQQLTAMLAESPQHLAHEFLSGHWQPLHSAEVIEAFAADQIQWIGSATPIENIDALSVPANVLPLLHASATPTLAETVRDAACHQSLRRDLFQRQSVALSGAEHMAALDALSWIATPGMPAHHDVVLDTRIGQVQAPPQLCAPLLQRLAQGPLTHAQLRQLPVFAGRADLLNQITQALLWAGWLHPHLATFASTQRLAGLRAALQQRTAPRWQPWPQAGTALPQDVQLTH